MSKTGHDEKISSSPLIRSSLSLTLYSYKKYKYLYLTILYITDTSKYFSQYKSIDIRSQHMFDVYHIYNQGELLQI